MNANVYAAQHEGPTVAEMENDHCAEMAATAMFLARTGAASVATIVADYANKVMAVRAAGNVRRANATRSFIATLAAEYEAIGNRKGAAAARAAIRP